jgi:O-phosphoseryl-tRNA(Cys) synthetase
VIAYVAGVSETAVERLNGSSGKERVEAAKKILRFWERAKRVYEGRLYKRGRMTWDDLRRKIERKLQFIDERAIRIIQRIAARKGEQ